MADLKKMLENVAKRYGKKTAIASGDFRMSYTDLEESSNRIAGGLLEMGVRKGDRVAILLNNGPQFACIFFGIVKTGAIAVPLDTKYKTRELNCLLEHCRPNVIFTESPYLEAATPLITGLEYIEHVISLSTSGSNGRILSYEELVAKGSAKSTEIDFTPDDEACIMYTSGPALTPKGAVLSHANLVRALMISADGFHQSDRDVAILFALPMHHIVGLIIILLTSICRGSTVIILPGLSIDGLMAVIEREKATIFIGVPFIHALIVKKVREEGVVHNLKSLCICGSIGSTLSQKLAGQFERYLGFRLIDFYGLTESTSHVTCQPLNGSGKPGSVGKALPGWDVKIVDDNNREMPDNQGGEVIIKGPIMSRYYKSPHDTDEMIKHGWLYTADIGSIDGEGHLFLTGLKKDMIIAKGQNIYPSDIETVLLDHSKIADAAVAGIPDEMRGEVVGAAVVLRAGKVATEQEIKNFCLEHLANFKVPKKIIFLDSLPGTDDGRINKQVVKKHLFKAYTAGKEKGKLES